jgi:hypothetical protein
MYQNYGPGCLRVETSFLNKFTSNNKFTLFGDVKYSKSENETIIRDLFKILNDNITNIYDDYKLLLSWLCIVIPLLKPQEKSLENECRIVKVEVHKNIKLITPECIKEIEFLGSDVKPKIDVLLRDS